MPAARRCSVDIIVNDQRLCGKAKGDFLGAWRGASLPARGGACPLNGHTHAAGQIAWSTASLIERKESLYQVHAPHGLSVGPHDNSDASKKQNIGKAPLTKRESQLEDIRGSSAVALTDGSCICEPTHARARARSHTCTHGGAHTRHLCADGAADRCIVVLCADITRDQLDVFLRKYDSQKEEVIYTTMGSGATKNLRVIPFFQVRLLCARALGAEADGLCAPRRCRTRRSRC
jgi:hypothetical protein